MFNPEYRDIPDIHQSVERFFGQVGNQIREDLKLLGSRRFWAKFAEPGMIGACTIAYGLIRWMVSFTELVKDQTNLSNILGSAEGVGIMALGAVIFYRFNRPKWWKMAAKYYIVF